MTSPAAPSKQAPPPVPSTSARMVCPTARPQRSAAATVVGSHLVRVTIGTSGLSRLGDKRVAVVDVLRKVAQKLGTS